MRRLKYMAGMFLLLNSVWMPAQQELDRYLLTAAENNPGLRARFSEYMAALEAIPQAGSLPDPQVAFGWFILPVETRMGPQEMRLSASQMFPWFGTLKARENAAVQAAKAKYEAFMEARSSLFNQVRATYFDLYLDRRSIQITRENLGILTTFRNLANIKVESGKVSAVDEYRIAMEIGDMENMLALLLDQQRVLEVTFVNLLNAGNELKVETPEVLWTGDPGLEKDQLLDTIRSKNHRLLMKSFEREALEYRKEVAQRTGKPNMVLGIDYMVIGRGPDNLQGSDALVFPMVGISIPLYRNKYRAMVNEVIHLQEAKELEKESTANMLETLFERAWKDYLDSGRRMDLYRIQQDLAGQSMKLLETEYATGNKDFEEILRMERRLLNYALELERARTDNLASLSFINYLMGK